MSLYSIESQVVELNNKFKRLIHHLGNNNSSGFVLRDGLAVRLSDNEGNIVGPSQRYVFEVEFTYLLNEILSGPYYIAQKYIDKANTLILELIAAIKEKNGNEEVEND
jgi:hypothetical protein